LELGVQSGGSIRAWAEYLPKAKIVGVDIETSFKSESDRITIEIGDQSDAKFIEYIAKLHGPFHIVVDDSSHQPKHQQLAFELIWPYVLEHGVYIIEDLQVSYHPHFQNRGYIPSLDFFKAMATFNALRMGASNEPWILFAGEMLAVLKP
jgi:cephalosporin hydroxylase